MRRLVRALAGFILGMLTMACCFGGLFDEPPPPGTPVPAAEPARAGEVRSIPSCSGPRCAIVHARSLSADGTDAFVAVGDAIVRLRDDDASHATVLAPTTGTVVALAAASTHVLWIERGVEAGRLLRGRIVRAARDGGPHEIVASDLHTPSALAAAGDDLVWIERGDLGEGGSLIAARLDGSDRRTLASGDLAPRVALFDGRAYFVRYADTQTLHAVGLDGTDEQLVVRGGQPLGSPLSFAIDASGVYVGFQRTVGSGSVERYREIGGAPTRLASGLFTPWAMWLEADRVLVAQHFEGVQEIPHDGEPIQLVRGGGYVEHIAATAGVVWVIQGQPPRAYRIARAP